MIRRSFGFIRFLIFFAGEFIKANLEVARLILFVPKSKYKSGFVNYSIDDLSFNEALFLSHCITLTPGTIIAVFDWEKKNMRIHVLDFSDSFAVDNSLKQAIWRFSR